MSDRKPWEEPVRYSHEATSQDNPPYDHLDASPVDQNPVPEDEVFGLDEDDMADMEDYTPPTQDQPPVEPTTDDEDDDFGDLYDE